jgi:hypothetical protein
MDTQRISGSIQPLATMITAGLAKNRDDRNNQLRFILFSLLSPACQRSSFAFSVIATFPNPLFGQPGDRQCTQKSNQGFPRISDLAGDHDSLRASALTVEVLESPTREWQAVASGVLGPTVTEEEAGFLGENFTPIDQYGSTFHGHQAPSKRLMPLPVKSQRRLPKS